MRSTIISVIERVAFEQKKTMAPLTDDLPLVESGLDSLCLAILVARLEDITGRDPFGLGDVSLPTTVGELVAFYEHVA
jgi:acyl carrier protein